MAPATSNRYGYVIVALSFLIPAIGLRLITGFGLSLNLMLSIFEELKYEISLL